MHFVQTVFDLQLVVLLLPELLVLLQKFHFRVTLFGHFFKSRLCLLGFILASLKT